MPQSSWLKGLTIVVVLLVGRPVLADKKAEAKQHFEAGLKLVETEDWEGAIVEFETSVGLYPTKMGLFNLANCFKATHRYGEALSVVERLEQEFAGDLDGKWQEEVRAFKAAVGGLVGRLRLEVEPPGTQIEVDGRAKGVAPLAEVPLGPGDHRVRLTKAGHETAERTVRVTARATVTLVVSLAPTGQPAAARVEAGPPPPDKKAPVVEPVQVDTVVAKPIAPEPAGGPAPTAEDASLVSLTPLFWVGAAGTVASGVVWGVFGALGSSRNDDYEKLSGEYGELMAGWDPQDEALVTREDELFGKLSAARDDAALYGNVALGAAIGTGVFAAVAVVGLFVGGEEQPAEAGPAVTAVPGGVAVAF